MKLLRVRGGVLNLDAARRFRLSRTRSARPCVIVEFGEGEGSLNRHTFQGEELASLLAATPELAELLGLNPG